MQEANPSLYAEASKTLSIVVPAYNEEKRLPSTLEETLRHAVFRAQLMNALLASARSVG